MNPEFILFFLAALLTVGMGIVLVTLILRGARQGPPTSSGFPSGPPAGAATGVDAMQPSPVPPEKIVLRGLQDLLNREADGAFAVFEHAATQKFVQFRSGPAGIELEFPLIDLTKDERRRADEYFGRIGASQPDGGTPGEGQPVYLLRIGKDAARGAEVAMQVFEQVFQLPRDLRLYVKTE